MSDSDDFYIKAINALHSKEHLKTGGPSPLQKLVEEAIKEKTGKIKDFTSVVAAVMNQKSDEDLNNLSSNKLKSEAMASSNLELENDLLKEDLMCVVCDTMDVGAGNLLVECSVCRSLYHQTCHSPVVTQQEAGSTWICLKCQDIEKLDTSPTNIELSSSQSEKSVLKSVSSDCSSSDVAGSSNKSDTLSTIKSLSALTLASSSKPVIEESSSSTAEPSSSSASKPNVRRNVDIESANKRIQNMKKKAKKSQGKKRFKR